VDILKVHARHVKLDETVDLNEIALATSGAVGSDLANMINEAAINAVKKLSADIGIPADLKAIVKAEDIPFLAQSAYDDACRPGNPRDTSVEEITALYKSLI